MDSVGIDESNPLPGGLAIPASFGDMSRYNAIVTEDYRRSTG